MTWTRLFAAAVVIALTASCSKTATSPQTGKPLFGTRGSTPFGYNAAAVDVTNEPGTVFKVTYKPSTTIIDAPTVRRTFAGSSTDGKTWKFDGSAGQIAALKPGSVVLFSDLALLKVDGVRSENGQTLIDAAPAALTDAIRDGEIRIRHDIRFDQLFGNRIPEDAGSRQVAAQGLLNVLATPAQAAESPGNFCSPQPAVAAEPPPTGTHPLSPPSVTAPSPPPSWGSVPHDARSRPDAAQGLLNLVATPALADINLSGEGITYKTTIKDFDITAQAKEIPGKLCLVVKASRSWQGIEVLAQMKGEVTNYRQDVDVQIAGGEFQSVAVNQNGLSGFADFEIEGHKDAPGPGTLDATAGFLGIPSIINIPLTVGGIPITIGLGTAMLIRPAFTGNGEFVDYHYKFEFGEMKASWSKDGGTTTPTESNTPELVASRALSAIGPLGFVGALAVPRVEVGFGLATEAFNTVNFGPSVILQLILSGSITSNGTATAMLPCQVTTAHLFFKVSSKVSLLGLSVSGPSKTVELGKRTWIDPAIEGCLKFAKEAEGSSQ